MAKAKFEVGESEKHTIDVNANIVLKYIRIYVDGERVINVVNLTPTRDFKLEVGNSETHQVEIKIRAFTPRRLFVDGNEAQQI